MPPAAVPTHDAAGAGPAEPAHREATGGRLMSQAATPVVRARVVARVTEAPHPPPHQPRARCARC